MDWRADLHCGDVLSTGRQLVDTTSIAQIVLGLEA